MQTRLKEVRKRSGMKQEEAASAFGVSIGTYRNWEQGRVVMNGEQLIAAAERFDTTVDYILMTDVEEPEEEPMEELATLYGSMNDEGQAALLVVARGLAQAFAR